MVQAEALLGPAPSPASTEKKGFSEQGTPQHAPLGEERGYDSAPPTGAWA